MNSAFDPAELELLRQMSERLAAGFDSLPAAAPAAPQSLGPVLDEVADRLRDNYPYFHPLYAGQMLKPPHPVARLAYALALGINPNNHALDGGRASSLMEKEAVAALAAMVGWNSHLGHLCGGGTMANLEALWIAGSLRPGKTILASEQAHYTHQRISQVLALPFERLPVDGRARLDLSALETRLRKGDVGTVVATLGTTASGSVDPLPEILALRQEYGFRLHADAAYGGYYGLAEGLLPETRAAFEGLAEVDSLVIDPHKHGLQPYGCGCVLFRDPEVGRFYRHDSPYTYFSSEALHLGEISLECSRPGAAAVALWATQKLLPLSREGVFAQGLTASRAAAVKFHHRLRNDPRVAVAFPPELDIVIWIPRAARLSQSSRLARRVFEEAARGQLYLALATLPAGFFELDSKIERDAETVTCLRSVLMKPEHLPWLDRIWEILERATDAALLG
jgi:glutamate/tyrosine decarboxylase-like PLP-dependent enzyme